MSDQNRAQGQQQGRRDMVFCHECEDEWYRDEHGLTCPECGSDFTEIIEEEHDPRVEMVQEEPMPPLPFFPLLHHNPFMAPEEPQGGERNGGIQLRQTGPGAFTISGTMVQNLTPRAGETGQNRQDRPPVTPMGQNFLTMLQNIVGAAAPNQGPTPAEAHSPQGTATGERRESDSQNQERNGQGGTRFTHHATFRYGPRDANGPQPQVQPVDELQAIITGLLGNLAQPVPGGPPGFQTRNEGQGNVPGGAPNPFHPLGALFTTIINPGMAQQGDFVYTQEALDRVISQLMEQNASGNAPPPAPEDAIKSLPKKKVVAEMLGSDGKADCSICMDEVNIGEDVTELPCHHWFHEQCITAWLKEHNTCPHCRKGITPDQNQQSQSQGGNAGGASGGGSGTTSSGDASRGGAAGNSARGQSEEGHSHSDIPGPIPGAFATGAGTSADPFVIHDCEDSEDHNQNEGGGGGLGDRIWGLFARDGHRGAPDSPRRPSVRDIFAEPSAAGSLVHVLSPLHRRSPRTAERRHSAFRSLHAPSLRRRSRSETLPQASITRATDLPDLDTSFSTPTGARTPIAGYLPSSLDTPPFSASPMSTPGILRHPTTASRPRRSRNRSHPTVRFRMGSEIGSSAAFSSADERDTRSEA